MNKFRWRAATAVVNGKIFCSGGICNYTPLNSVEYYDPSSDVWILISNMPQEITGHGAVEINGHFIVMGGSINYFQYSNKVWALDTRNRNAAWIEKPSMAIPRIHFSITKIHDKVFVCGGRATLREITDSLEIFDGEVWRSGPRIPTTRWHAPAVVIPMEFARVLQSRICSIQ